MDTSTARPVPMPQLAQNGKRLQSASPDPEGPRQPQSQPQSQPQRHHQHHQHSLSHNHPGFEHGHGRPQSRTKSRSRSKNRSRSSTVSSINTALATTARDSRNIPVHGAGTGLSLREQQQQRNQQAAAAAAATHSNSNCNDPNTGSLTLSITPPKQSSYLTADPSSCNANNADLQRQQNGSNNSQLGDSHDSLGSSLSQPTSSASTASSRRASFNLSTGSLNFNPSTSISLASPSSPSYSTIAVARARAAAAAAAAAEGQGAVGWGERGQRGTGSGGGHGGFTESGVFPGASSSMQFSSTASSSSSFPQDSTYNSGSQPPFSSSLASSPSSVLSNASGGTSPPLFGSGLGSRPSSSSKLPTHLQDNAEAEREISMILDNFLFVGGELVEEEQILELERLGIKRVLNMAINCDDELWIRRFGTEGYLKIGLLDHVDQDLKEGLNKAIEFIASSTEPVYVHCQAGKSRSVATVIGYLIQECRWPLKKAYDHMVKRRRIMSPNIGFVSQLIMLEECILGPERAGGLVSVGDEVDPASRTTVVPWMSSS
ncbi:hypothetical protein BC939DRAFT_452939 [Gamsiella multidivaricata]|uniref:uncharacterized protein n=1 Tax=Gamsiella multidivaricata TaxID=101098 RepID=UPI00221E4BD2|nr:uncharacterized protein BC939DRAFT_452939 [Gamsiella multidivaricata]KAG0355741.1 hypothetical protein BGZ54_001026 [Gamsiella multidivaricata]KAI7822900.1 hypothetical protein BC939DRAFT_452939 [Gamsiella multidivaricata]